MIQGDSPPTIEDFDKKLSETDCYLQILLNQVAALKVKIGQYFIVSTVYLLLKKIPISQLRPISGLKISQVF